MNHMQEVAKMLGVELGEKFKIYAKGFDSNYDYYLTRNGIIIDKDGHGCASNDVLCNILYGNYAIKHKPWKPKNGEEYWSISALCYDAVCIRRSGCWADIMYYKVGNCYRTKEEAEANRDKWIAFYASDEVLEV